MTRIVSALRALAARAAQYVLRREPVLTGGVIAGVVLAVLAWCGVTPGVEARQWLTTVANLVAPIVTALVARVAAWSPQRHAEVIAIGAHMAPTPDTPKTPERMAA